MKYGDIVVYKNQIGTVVKSENDFKFHPCNYGSCYFSELDTITDADVRKAGINKGRIYMGQSD